MPSSSQNPSREVAEIEEVPDDNEVESADPSRLDDDDELVFDDDDLIVEEIELDEMPSMEGPDA